MLRDGQRHGPWEQYNSSSIGGDLESRGQAYKGSYNMNEKCGEWIEYARTVTYPPC